ncbi:MAG: EamA family transporter [Pseudomonadota bacterium]|nr:DMT family transporter [Pseudomonadota bacterium]MBU1569457.1 DMT family transporter [Pseudomonadota bacterium]
MKQAEKIKTPRLGYLYVVIAALLWAISGSSAKFLFHSGVSPFQLVQLRLTISTGLLFLVLLIWRRNLMRIKQGDLFYFVFFGAVVMAAVQFTYLFAISKINVAAAILLQYLAPVFIAIYSFVFAKEKPGLITILSIAGAITGCYLVVGAYNLNLFSLNKTGIIAGILSAIAFAWYSVHGEYGMRKYDPVTVLFFALLFAAITWNVLHPPLEAFFHTRSLLQWGLIFYIGIFGTVIPFGFYFEGINLIRSTRASITGTLEPISAAAISYFFLNEILEPLQMAGGIMVIAAIILLQFKVEYDDKTPDLVRTQNLEKSDK